MSVLARDNQIRWLTSLEGVSGCWLRRLGMHGSSYIGDQVNDCNSARRRRLTLFWTQAHLQRLMWWWASSTISSRLLIMAHMVSARQVLVSTELSSPEGGFSSSAAALTWWYHVDLETWWGCLKLHLMQVQAYWPLHVLEAIGEQSWRKAAKVWVKGRVEMWSAHVRPLTSTYSHGYTMLHCVQHTVQMMQSMDNIAGRSTPKRKLSYLLHTSSYFSYRFHISSHVVTPGKVQFSLGLMRHQRDCKSCRRHQRGYQLRASHTCATKKQGRLL